MSTYDNQPPVDGWVCCPHREPPCMTTPAVEPCESHIIRSEN